MEYEELSDISDYPNWVEITPIELGSSGENKYHITRSNGAELILRTADIRNYKRQCESAMFAQYIHNSTGINMNVPVEVAACCSDRLTYTIYSWVEGEDADERIPNMHTPEQARFGEKAGLLLKKIHSIKAPDNVMPWDIYFGQRIDRILGYYKYARLSFRGDSRLIGYIENSRGLLKDRPQTAIHGDFRSGNLVIGRDGEFGVIDFGRWCWGDPYLDFQCIRRSCTASFARGQIMGYFGGSVPGDFFSLLALYIAADAVQAVCDAHSGGKKDFDKAAAYAERTVREYNNFEGLIPTWY